MARIFFNKLALIIAMIFSLAIIWSLNQTKQKFASSSDVDQALKQEVEGLQLEISQLQTEIVDSENESSQEQIIRNDLLMQKENEYVVQISDPHFRTTGNDDNKTEQKSSSFSHGNENLRQWLELIFE